MSTPPTSQWQSGGGGGGGGPVQNNPQQQQPGPQATQLEFTQAMTDFKVMFPAMDAEVIEAVLRANNGAVDATIDHLLVMTADNERDPSDDSNPPAASQTQSTFDQPPAYSGGSVGPPSYQQATTKPNGAEEADLINLGGAASGAGAGAVSGFSPSSTVAAAAAASGSEAPGSTEKATPLDLLAEFDALGASGQPDDIAGALALGNPKCDTNNANGGGPDQAAIASSLGASPKHAYSHPKRQEAEEEALERRQQQQGGGAGNMLPTQQQLQEIYEENLRSREEMRGSSDAAAKAQYLEDERIALMLQNEEFMAELRRDTDFMSALEMEQERAGAYYGGNDPHVVGVYPAGGAGATSKSKDEEFREKLKNMGKNSKRKFSQMAAMFSRRKGAAKQLLGHAPAPSKDSLLLAAEPLVNEDDTDTEDDRPSQPSHSSSSSAKTSKQKTPTKGKYTSFS